MAPEQLKYKLPLPSQHQEQIARHREEIASILNGTSHKKLMIVGPCSVDFQENVLEYANKLKDISDKVKDEIFIVMRTYTAKPRTTVWWKWVLYNGEYGSWGDMNDGLVFSRDTMMKIIEKGLPVADEMLYPQNHFHFDDLLSYIAVGARSVEDQLHREVASASEIAVGMKNPTSGDLEITVNSLIAARSSQQALIGNALYQTDWNPLSHILLRGSCSEGKSRSNMDLASIEKIHEMMASKWITSSIMIDLNHDNSGKWGLNQVDNVRSLLQMNHPSIKWYMVESNLEDGNQKASEDDLESIERGQSITDHCLGIQKTEKLIIEVFENQKDNRLAIAV